MLTASSVGCRRCPLSCSRRSIVDGAGPLDSVLMVVGEYPHRDEDRASSPFVGASGRLTRSAIAAICQRLGVDASKVFYTYAVRCKPKDGSTPTEQELEECQGWLIEELETVQPVCVLALGGQAQAQTDLALLAVDRSVHDMKKAFAPYYIIKNKGKLGNWLLQLEIAIRRAFQLPDLSAHSGNDGNVEAWTFGDPDLTAEFLAADTETDDLAENFSPDKVGWSISDGKVSTFRIDETPPLGHVYLHNAKYDLAKLAIDPNDLTKWDCTMLQAYCLRKYERVGLKDLGPKLTGIQWDSSIKDLLREYIPSGAVFKSGPRKGQEKPGKWIKAPFSKSITGRWEEASKYAATDAVVTSRLAMVLHQEMDAAPWAKAYYESFEKPLLPVLLSMEQAGVRVDPSLMREAETVIMANRASAEERLRIAFGPDINLASGPQMGPILYDMGIVDGKRTDGGDIATGKPNILAAFGADKADEIPDTEEGRIARDLLEWRQMGKLKSTYVDALLSRLDAGYRVHGRYNQASTNTNRLSSSDPNLQNIPSRSDIGMAIRKAFVPAPGCLFVGGDFSQLQLRLFGELTHEPTFVNAYAGDGADFHQYAADVLARPRAVVKNFVFAVLFGADAPKAAATAGVPQEQATGFIAQLREQIPSLVTWQDLTAQILTTKGYVESLMGWRGFFTDYSGMVNQWSSAALREAANFRVQATEAGLVKAVMIEVYNNFRRYYNGRPKLVLQVHDEIWAECPKYMQYDVEIMMKETAETVAKRWIKTVPIRFDTKTVTSWGLAK
jgi:uracil-DNA glycosylase family 4